MTHAPLESNLAIWIAIALCLSQCALFSGLNLAIFSISRLRLEVRSASGDSAAQRVLLLRQQYNLTLATILWGNVAVNVLLTLLSNSVLAGVTAFLFSTVVITTLGEIIPQAYFSRHALSLASKLTPWLRAYELVLYPVAKPTALLLNRWLGEEAILLFRERDFRALIARHIEDAVNDVGTVEGTGALNFLDLDDVRVREAGESVDPRSVIALPIKNGLAVLPSFERSADDPFLRRLDASGKKWIIITDLLDNPLVVLNAHRFLRDCLFRSNVIVPEAYWHRPVVVTDLQARLGEVIGRMRVSPRHSKEKDQVIQNDLILVWGAQRRIITGADLLGRLLRGIAGTES